MFDALERLQEGEVEESVIADFQPLPPVKANKPILWIIGLGLNILLFIGQIEWFEGNRLAQNEQLRPWLSATCRYLNCQLPQYKDIKQITSLYSALEPSNNHYILRLTLVNQAPFQQHYPNIKLSLIDFTGRPFAERVFFPDHYLTDTSQQLEPNSAVEISLNIAAPKQKIGGYQIKLT